MLTKTQLRKLRSARLDGPNKVRLAMTLTEETQVELAAAVERSQPYISAIVNGTYSALPLEMARALAQHYGCTIEDLFPACEAIAS